ncbi:Chromosome segregation in meiosis protein [Cercospora zeina]
MPSAVSSNNRAGSPPPDELDRLFNDDQAIEEFFNDLPRNTTDDNNNTTERERTRDEDQEVQVKKKRVPVPKLDENRLLSDAGIPKLRKITKSRLKFRGKGHEFTDIANLLNTYQLWLDDLYPRAKFRDAVKMVEKVGHSKRMQVARRAWLDDTKPYRKELTPPTEERISGTTTDGAANEQQHTATSAGLGVGPHQRQNHGGQPGEDELDALMADAADASTNQQRALKLSGPFEEDDDELDSLLANTETATKTPLVHKSGPRMPFEDEPDDDEIDALMAEESTSLSKPSKTVPTAARQEDDDFADDEEAMRDMW